MKTKKSFKMRPLVAAFITVTALSASLPVTTPKANALLPVTDYANYVQAWWSDMNRSFEAMKEQSILLNTLKSIGTYSEMMVDNANNGFANVIARLGKGEEERQNLDQLEKSMPAQDACSTMTVSSNLGDAVCDGLDAIAAAVSGRSGNNKMATGGGSFTCTATECTPKDDPPTADEVNKKNSVDAVAVVDKCKELTNGSGGSLCNVPSLMFNAPGGTLSKEEYKAVQLQIEIAGNVEKPVPNADATIKKDSPQFKRAVAQDLRRENIRESAVIAQTNLNILMNGTLEGDTRKPGEIESLQKYLNERLGSDNWVCEVTNSCGSATKYVPPAELEKRKIQMDAVMLHIALQQYKSSLRTEKYLTDMALMEIEPVGK
jgi:hypothetical protein